MINEYKLKFWIDKNLNVLFVGKHGVGKTTTVLNAFNEAKLKWLYFSGSTLDPWVDFIGVPKEQKDENGNVYLDLVRPKHFQNDEVEAIFIDELNRSHKKVRNAVLELIQFKSINGKKFPHLRIVWAAINPNNEDEEEEGNELKYDVEKLDPAIVDRFHIKVDVPYKPDASYFKKKFGNETAGAAISWWHDLEKKIQNEVSPRRLDYALEMHQMGGDIRDVLNTKANVSKLLDELNNGSYITRLANYFKTNNTTDAKTFLSKENYYNGCIKTILKSVEYVKFFMPLIDSEKLGNLISKESSIRKYVLNNATTNTNYKSVLDSFIQMHKSSKIAKEIISYYIQNNITYSNGKINTFHKNSITLQYNPQFKRLVKSQQYTFTPTDHKTIQGMYYNNTWERLQLYNTLSNKVDGSSITNIEFVLGILETKIISRTQAGSLKRGSYHFKNILEYTNEYLNLLLIEVQRSSSFNMRTFISGLQMKYPSIFRKLTYSKGFIFV